MQKSKIASLVILLIGANVLFLFLRVPENARFPIPAILFVGIITLFVTLLVQGAFISDLQTNFKNKFVSRLVKGMNPNLTYSMTSTLTTELFNESMLFEHQAALLWGEDMITGSVGGTRIQFAEITALETTRDSEGKVVPIRIIFRGLFYELEFNKPFRGKTLVIPDTKEATLGKVIGQWLQSMDQARGELIKLEDPEFERYFAVYGDDQIEARYILSPSLMRRITEYRKKAGRPLRMSFRKGKVYVAIAAPGNFLELNLNESIHKRENLSKHLDELEFALGIVEDLNLNRRIWQS